MKTVFSDEKIFNIEQVHNSHNDRVYAANRSDLHPDKKFVQRRQGPASVMVWAGVCASGKTPLVFLEKGVKVNQEIYRKQVLEDVLLPWAQIHFGNQQWVFQQDSAPAHRAKTTQAWLHHNVPRFITSQQWPPYSPDLNPLDYSIWSILESKVCATKHTTVESLKRHLLAAWEEIDVEILTKIVLNFEKRLDACIKSKGGHFENP